MNSRDDSAVCVRSIPDCRSWTSNAMGQNRHKLDADHWAACALRARRAIGGSGENRCSASRGTGIRVAGDRFRSYCDSRRHVSGSCILTHCRHRAAAQHMLQGSRKLGPSHHPLQQFTNNGTCGLCCGLRPETAFVFSCATRQLWRCRLPEVLPMGIGHVSANGSSHARPPASRLAPLERLLAHFSDSAGSGGLLKWNVSRALTMWISSGSTRCS